MPLFSRVKVWTTKEILTYSDLNAEFDNIINNIAAATTVGYSATVAQMRTQTNPGNVGSESLASSISGELERIRYVIARITGKTYWYEPPINSLSQSFPDMSWYFPCNGNGQADVINNFATRGCRGLTKNVSFYTTGIINETTSSLDAGPSAVSSANVVSYSGGITKKFSLTSSGFVAVDGNSVNANKGTLHIMFRNVSAGDYLFHNKNLGLEVFANSSGNLVVRATSKNSASQTTKQTFTVTSTVGVTGVTLFRQLFVDYAFNGVEGSGSDRISFLLKDLSDGVVDSGSLVNQTILINDDGYSGGVWYIGARHQDPASWTGFSAMAVRPDSETVPWTRVASAGVIETVTNGILRTTTPIGLLSTQYTKSISPSFSTGSTFEWKVNLNSNLETSGMNSSSLSGGFTVKLQDSGTSRFFNITIDRDTILVNDGANYIMSVPVKLNGPTTIRATFSTAANPVITLYLNGACIGSCQNSNVSAAASYIQFISAPSGNANTSIDLEYFAYSLGSIVAPLASNVSGNIDEACLFSSRIGSNSTLLSSLNTAPVSTVLQKDRILGLRPLALVQPNVPQNSTQLVSNSLTLGMILGDGQTDISIFGSGVFGINTLAVGSYRLVRLYYAIGTLTDSAYKTKVKDVAVNETASSHATLSCRSIPGINAVYMYSVSSNAAYSVLADYRTISIAATADQNRE